MARDVLINEKLNLAVVGPFRSDKSFQSSLKGLGWAYAASLSLAAEPG